MIDLEAEKKRLVELEAECEHKKNQFGDQLALGRLVEARRWIELLEQKPAHMKTPYEPNGC